MTKKTKLTPKQRVARYLRRRDGLTKAELSRALNMHITVTADALFRLKNEGVIKINRDGNQYRYYLTDNPEHEFGVHRLQAKFNQLLAEVRA
ncbi:hypothetical protein B4923_16325 [Brenneria roseae subsp. americana]|uniref:MarR family transcriptional regulator n=1 Tax=Brenneria roseae subsp. americana TaxID=1508507 RepID=A0A2U1TMN7_9GAMM|nr:helix-turn-helix transcriptional regulator [Brenneria roseae]PWC10683.1 hypothetical protein B4923_16325 [Brenneria roseae subsp. americana]